ncbi:MAG: ribosomal subunit interface protein [Chloroflexi bacterium RBG_19FT_COMBO_48_23]|nr:MAG: ribosomal subunit interface protein [Chloroflexi bacterium RBG_19FT_COMBO_48_23]
MELQISSKNMEISPAVRNYVQKKIGKLAHYLPNITEAKVEIHEENTKSPEHRFTAQVTLNSKGVLLRGEERGERVRVAVDAVADVLARQIERYKGKLHDKERGVSLTRQSAVSEVVIGNAEARDWPKIVRVKRFTVKPMSVTEAAERMELLGHSFFLFINDEDASLALLYRRDDGDYGLIEPDLA